MEQIKTVGIRELKNGLSSYIRDIKRGWRILVSDRNQVVAELREPFSQRTGNKIHPLYEAWVRDGKIRLPLAKRTKPASSSPVRLPEGTALNLLNEDRTE